MILWINGSFGAGKTQAAYALHRRVAGSYVYDPENAGSFIRKNLPAALHTNDYQDCPLWRSINRDMLAHLAEHHDGLLIVPMTITNRQYYQEITASLPEKCPVKHIILCASRETLLRRLASRGEGKNSWGAQQIQRCLQSFAAAPAACRLDTDSLNISQVAEALAARAGIPLAEDRRGPLRRGLDRLAVQLRHIR